ncbi:MAG TPA: hypothetical protein PKW52_12600 [Nitrospira sp.]|mgnify:FL=1|nr:hypothetical protein [Nitrospira sp.]MCE7976758.1 hypothetical protein [Nitrospira sp. NTP1]HQR14712.1 hypothetical protein [Nitrospira sp.]HQV12179.1 hypothetical protein [Nitrospira sp.]
MMMSPYLKIWYMRGWMVVILAAGALTAGCMHHPGGIAPSTKPLAPGGYIELGKVRGQDCVYHLLGLIPVTGGNEMRNAVEDALRTKPLADAMVEVTVDGYFQYFILFSRACTQVYGTAVETK